MSTLRLQKSGSDFISETFVEKIVENKERYRLLLEYKIVALCDDDIIETKQLLKFFPETL